MDANREKWLERTALLLGEEKLGRLRRSRVLVVGLGGVGAYAAEMIARAGVGHMTVADADVVSESNINRQLIALHSTVGRRKTEVMAERLRDINPDIDLRTVARFIKDEETYTLLDSDRFDYVVDAIDTLSPKLALIIGAMERGIPLVSSMGAGAKTDPARMEIADISSTQSAQGGYTVGVYGCLFAGTGARGGSCAVRGAEQEVEHGNHILYSRSVRHRLRVGCSARPCRGVLKAG